jgi:hypothetical protein
MLIPFFAVAHFIFLAPISLQRGAVELWKFLIAQLVQMGLAQRSSFFCLEVQMVQSSCGLTSLRKTRFISCLLSWQQLEVQGWWVWYPPLCSKVMHPDLANEKNVAMRMSRV